MIAQTISKGKGGKAALIYCIFDSRSGGIVASIMALDRAIRNGMGGNSIYDERGIIAF